MHGILCHEFMCLGERGDFSDAMSYFKLQLNQGNGIQIFVSCIYPFLSGKSRYILLFPVQNQYQIGVPYAFAKYLFGRQIISIQ